MTSLALLLTLATLAQAPAAPEAAPSTPTTEAPSTSESEAPNPSPAKAEGGEAPQRWRLESDDGWVVGTKRFAVGNARLWSDAVSLRAEHLVFDEETQRAEASGNVLLVGTMGVAFTEHLTLDLPSETAILDNGVFMQKSGVTPQQLSEAASAEELRSMGVTKLVLGGRSIQRVDENTVRVRGLSFTPCDCDLSRPSWKVTAWSSTVKPGESASLWFPVVHLLNVPLVGQVPIFAFPYLDLPFEPRRSGLMFPRPRNSQSGFELGLPVFLTLGDSYDLTFTPTYMFGTNEPAFGSKGLRLGTEFRYAPTPGFEGSVSIGLLNDQKFVRDPFNPTLVSTEKRGLRGDLRILHQSELGGFSQRLDLAGYSDGYLRNDFTASVIAQAVPYLRSTASLFKRFPDAYVGMHAVLRQNIVYGFSLLGRDRTVDANGAFGPEVTGPATFQELPSLHVYVPQKRVLGSLRVGAHASFTRMSPLLQRFGDEGADGLWIYNPADALQGNSVFDARNPDGTLAESEARDRLTTRLNLSSPFELGILKFNPYAWYRGDVWLGELTGDLASRNYLLGGLKLWTEVVGTWGDSQRGGRHHITPEVELRGVPGVVGDGVERPYDAADAALTVDRFADVVAQVRQSVWLRRDGRSSELFRFDVGQGFSLVDSRYAETFARSRLFLGPIQLGGVARYNPTIQRLSIVSADINWAIRRNLAIGAGYDYFLGYGTRSRSPEGVVGPVQNASIYGSELQRRDLDRLLGRPAWQPFINPDAPFDTVFSKRHLIQLAVSAPLVAGFTARYNVQFNPSAAAQNGESISGFVSQRGVLEFSPSCGCWSVFVEALRQPLNLFPASASDLTWTTRVSGGVNLGSLGTLTSGP